METPPRSLQVTVIPDIDASIQNLALTTEQMQRIGALSAARALLVTDRTNLITKMNVRTIPSVGDMVYLAEWILGVPVIDDEQEEGSNDNNEDGNDDEPQR